MYPSSAKGLNTKRDWGKKIVINMELKIGHTIKWYLHKLKSVRENEAHTILMDFEIQTNYLI